MIVGLSVEHDSCPLMSGYERVHLPPCGWVLRPLANGVSSVTQITQIKRTKIVPKALFAMVMERLAIQIVLLRKLAKTSVVVSE